MESKGKDIYNQFSKSKQQQKYIWISSMLFVTVAFISTLVFLYFKSKQVVVIQENGQEVSTVVKYKEETFQAQSKQHIDRAFHYLNSFNRITYKLNKGKTLFYMDARAADRVWTSYEDEGVFADVLSKGTIYEATILPETIEVIGNSEPFSFKFQGIIKVQDGGYETTYLTKGQGKLIYYTPQYPHKTTGFFITDYTQNSTLYEQE